MWANNVDTPADTETSAKEIQQQYLELLGCTDWTRFGCGETHLIKQKIAFALFGEPTHLSEDLSDSNEQSTFGFTDLEIKDVIPVYNKICELKKYAADHQSVFMSVIFVCVVPEDSKITDITSCATTLYPSKDIRIVPVFRIRKCIKVDLSDNQKGCCLFVDNIGRVYKNWNLYLENNKLPKGVIVAPKNGFYDGVIMNEEAHVILDLAWSPASSAFAKARTVGNVVSTVVAVGATGILGLSMFTPLGPVVLGTTMAASALTGLYGTAVSTQHIVDRSQHQQSIGLENPEARSSWINIGVGTTGVIAGASSKLLTRAAQTGATIGIGIRAAHDTTIVLATLSSGAGIVNGIFNCIIRYNETKELPSKLEIFQMASSVLFFTNSLISSRMATTIIEETQTGLMNNYRSSLRSNRHRKIFDKLTAESRRLVGRTKGNSEVIKGITRIENRDQFFQNVLRLNKEFNENGVKISFGAGQLLLNNKHVINPQEFYNLNQADRVGYLTNLEPANTSASNFPTTSTSVNGPSFGVRLTPIISTTFAIQRLVNEFSDMNLSSSDDIIRYIAVKLTDFINNEDIFKKFLFIMKTLEESLNTYMREQLACLGIYGNDILYRIFDFVYNYFKCLCGSDAAIPSVVLNFFYDDQLNPDSIYDLLVYFKNKLNIDYKNTICSPDEKRCCICNGITFSAD